MFTDTSIPLPGLSSAAAGPAATPASAKPSTADAASSCAVFLVFIWLLHPRKRQGRAYKGGRSRPATGVGAGRPLGLGRSADQPTAPYSLRLFTGAVHRGGVSRSAAADRLVVGLVGRGDLLAVDRRGSGHGDRARVDLPGPRVERLVRLLAR